MFVYLKRINDDFGPQIMKCLLFLFPLFLGVVKNWYSHVLNLMLILSFVFCQWKWSLLDKREKRVLWGLVVFVLLSSLSLFNAQDLEEGFKWLKRLFYLLATVPLLLYFKRHRINPVMPFANGVLVASLVLATVAIYQVWTQNGVRAHGYINPNLFGEICVLYSLLGGALILVLGRVRRRWYFIGSVFSLVALFAAMLSQSRGALLPLLPALVLTLFLFRGKVSWRRTAAGLMVFTLLTGGLFYICGDGVVSRFSHGISNFGAFFSEGREDNNVGYRFQMWEVAVDMFREHPVIGSGLADFSPELREAIRQGRVSLLADQPHAHNIFFSALGTTGMFGFAGMMVGVIVLPFYLFYVNWRRSSSPEERLSALGGMLTVIAFACFGLTEVWYCVSFMVTLYAICLLVFIAGSNSGGGQWQQAD